MTQDELVYDKAKRGLPAMNPTEAVRAMLNLSPYKRQIFLVAEEDGLARGVVLNRFPKVSETMKERLHNGN